MDGADHGQDVGTEAVQDALAVEEEGEGFGGFPCPDGVAEGAGGAAGKAGGVVGGQDQVGGFGGGESVRCGEGVDHGGRDEVVRARDLERRGAIAEVPEGRGFWPVADGARGGAQTGRVKRGEIGHGTPFHWKWPAGRGGPLQDNKGICQPSIISEGSQSERPWL